MWRWQLSVPYKYGVFWAQLISLVLLVHVIVLAGLLFITHDLTLSAALTIRATFANGELPVVFMPLYKHVPGALQQLNQSVANAAPVTAKSRKVPTGYYVKARQLAKSRVKAAKVPAVSRVKKSRVHAVKTKAAAPAQSQPLAQLKAPAIRANKLVKAQRIAPVAVSTTAKITAAAPPVATAPALVAEPASTNAGLAAATAISNQELAANLADITQPKNFSPAGSESEIDLGRKDLELLQLQDQLRQNVAHSWRPPLGFTRDLTTVVVVVLGPTGQVEQIKVQESSGVAVFDASVQQALSMVAWPAAAWGRSHVLTFKQ